MVRIIIRDPTSAMENGRKLRWAGRGLLPQSPYQQPLPFSSSGSGPTPPLRGPTGQPQDGSVCVCVWGWGEVKGVEKLLVFHVLPESHRLKQI